MAKSPEEMTDAMIQNLEAKTGRPLAKWLEVVRASKLTKHGGITKLLKTDHGVTHGYANLIAHKFLEAGQPAAGEGDLVEQRYAGEKAALRPIYDALLAAVLKFGKDVEVASKKAYVSLRRSKQFAIIQPSTKTRVDVGINLKGVPPVDRLEASGSFNAMVTHRVRLGDKKEVDKQVVAWLQKAYSAT